MKERMKETLTGVKTVTNRPARIPQTYRTVCHIT